MTALAPLIPVAVIGTARRELDAMALPPSIRPGHGTAGSASEMVLSSAARAALIDKVTLPSPPAGEPPIPPAETQTPAASPAFGSALHHAVGANSPAVLAEALQLLAERNRRLPLGVLPTVLEAALAHRELRPLLPAVLGDRGSWLAGLNPRWRFDELRVPDPDDEDSWRFGTPAERTAWLRAVRRVDPDRARDMLAADFSGDEAATRAALLATFTTGLGPADEPFLESVLDDRARDVRALARSLLAGLPDSAYVGRMRDRIAARVKPIRGKRWQVDLSDLTAADRRDGLTTEPGEKLPGASAVRALVAGVPLSSWAIDFGCPAAELVTVRTGSLELGPVPGLRDAAVREADASAAAAILGLPDWPADPDLVACLDDGLRDAVLAVRVRSRGAFESLAELQSVGFGPATAEALLEWLLQSRSAGRRGPVFAALGTRGPRSPDWDLAARLRRLAGTFHGAEQNRAFQAAFTINLRRSLAAAID